MNKRGTATLFKKEIQRFKEVWAQTVIAPVVSNLLFMTVFGFALAERSSGFAEYGYLESLIPGLAAMGLMMNAYQNPNSSLMIAKYTNVISDLLRIPLRGFEIVSAYVLAGIVRGVLVAIATIGVGWFFVPATIQHPLLVLLFAVLLGGSFAAFGVIIGVIMPSFDKSSQVQNFVITPLLYLGGVFYSIRTLPDTIATISQFNPLLYLVNGFRFGFLGVSDVSLTASLLVSFGLFIILFGIASWMFKTGYKLQT